MTEQQSQSQSQPEKKEEFSLTDEEYEFLLEDIENTIAEGNEKYGYGDNESPDRPSIESIMIRRGLIKTRRIVKGVNQ